MSYVFISYVNQDAKIAALIRERLNKAGISTWQDTSFSTGERSAEIDEVLKNAVGMVLVLSPSTLNSPYVSSEYQYFLGQNKRLFPVLTEPIPIEDFPLSLSRLQYFDLTDDFDAGIQELVEAIKDPSYLATSKSPAPQVNVRLKIDRNKLSSLMATLIEAGAEKIEVENVGKSR